MKHKHFLLFVIVYSILLVGCDDKDSISGKIKSVYTYIEEDNLQKRETYEYDDQGRLIKERIVIDNEPEFTRVFTYDKDKIVSFTERNMVVNFTYDMEGKLKSISSQNIGMTLDYEDKYLKGAGNLYIFNYDDNQNLTSITNSDKSSLFMAKGSYEYDDKNYIYNSFPIELRLYFALFRSEWFTFTSDIFRFNSGPNNIKRNNLYSASGEVEFYHIFDYHYQGQGYPTRLNLETYSFDVSGNPRLDFTYYYTFEYY